MQKIATLSFLVSLACSTVIAHVFWPDSRWSGNFKWWAMYMAFVVIGTIVAFILTLLIANSAETDDYESRKS